jgi:hypothetical protein
MSFLTDCYVCSSRALPDRGAGCEYTPLEAKEKITRDCLKERVDKTTPVRLRTLRKDIAPPLRLRVALVEKLHTRHRWAIAMETAMLAAHERVEHPIPQALLPEL